MSDNDGRVPSQRVPWTPEQIAVMRRFRPAMDALFAAITEEVAAVGPAHSAGSVEAKWVDMRKPERRGASNV
jgi:hypothetical protein